MSAPDLAELRRLLADDAFNGESLYYQARHDRILTGDSGGIVVADIQKHHAALIVAAVNALPYLLTKVEAAEAMAEAAEEMVLQAYDDYDKCKVCQGESGGGVGHESNCAVVWLGKEAGAYRRAGAP